MTADHPTIDETPRRGRHAVGGQGELVVDLTRTCEVLALEPFRVGNGSPAAGTWSCTRCGREHPANTSVAVRLQRRSDLRELSVVVCPECARSLR